jgi:pyruvate kinase
MARGVDARCVVVPSITGQHARLLSRNDFLLPVLAMATDEQVVRRMLLYRGVVPYTVDVIPEGEELVRHANREVLARNWASPGESIIVVSGAPGHGNAGVQIVVHQVEAENGAG